LVYDDAKGNAMTREMQKPETLLQHDIEERVREVIARALELKPDQVSLTASLADEMGAQSLDLLDIAFMLERDFKISFPRTDIMERATARFGEDALVNRGLVTDLGLELLRRTMPEVDREELKPGLRAMDVTRLLTVQTFVRIVMRLLEAKQAFPRQCPNCGSQTEESEVTPEFICPKCGTVVPLTSGDDILFADLVALTADVQLETEPPA
jgi:acyl carrier protein